MSTPQRQPGFEDLRCSDSDRQLVTDVLTTAYAEGRISLDEHDERVDLAHAAKTFRDLNALTSDLIAGNAVAAPPSCPGSTLSPAPRGGEVATAEFCGGTAILSTFKPSPPLRIPVESTLTVALGEAKLDLVGAQFAASTVRLKLQACLGEVRIRVPEGVTVVDDITRSMAETKIRGTAPQVDGITLVLEGWSVMAEVRVLGPDSRPKKYERFVR